MRPGNFLNLRRLAVLLVLIAAGAAGVLGAAFAPVMAGFGAVVAAQHAFESGDPVEDIRADHLRLPFGLGRWVSLEIQRETRSARVTAFGCVTREAAWREDLGAVRLVTEAAPLAFAPRTAHAAPDPWELGAPARKEGDGAPDPHLASAVATRLQACFEAAPGATRAVVVVHRGRLLAERYREGTGPDTPLLGWSMTKSFLATMVGRWIELGRIAGPGQRIEAPGWTTPGDPRRALTVEHLLRMESGLAFDTGYTLPWSDSLQMLFVARDAAALAADKPLEHPPGTHWSYSDGTSNLLARFVQQRAGATLQEQVDLLHAELLDPLGMTTATLGVDPGGHWVGSSFLMASARDWARLGLLYLRDGVCGGRRLLPVGWTELVASPTLSSPWRVYGAHFWRHDADDPRDPDGNPVPRELAGVFYAAGYDHQFLWIDRARDVVMVRLGRRDPGFDPGPFAAGVLACFETRAR